MDNIDKAILEREIDLLKKELKEIKKELVEVKKILDSFDRRTGGIPSF